MANRCSDIATGTPGSSGVARAASTISRSMPLDAARRSTTMPEGERRRAMAMLWRSRCDALRSSRPERVSTTRDLAALRAHVDTALADRVGHAGAPLAHARERSRSARSDGDSSRTNDPRPIDATTKPTFVDGGFPLNGRARRSWSRLAASRTPRTFAQGRRDAEEIACPWAQLIWIFDLLAESHCANVFSSGFSSRENATSRAPQNSFSKSRLYWNMLARSSAPGKPNVRYTSGGT